MKEGLRSFAGFGTFQLCLGIAAALASVGQDRWDNFRRLLVDVTIVSDSGNERVPLLHAETPGALFPAGQGLLPSLIARVAVHRQDVSEALDVYTKNPQGFYIAPAAEWLHAILRAIFRDQFPDDMTYDEQFDRTEVILGLISQDLDTIRRSEKGGIIMRGRSKWFGRSAHRMLNNVAQPLRDIQNQLEQQGDLWGPLKIGLFGGKIARVRTAIGEYAEDVPKFARF